MALGLAIQWYRDTFVAITPVIQHVEPVSTVSVKSYQEMLITVHVAGAVVSPGVYNVEQDLRVLQVLDLAGGILPHADLDKVNLAKIVKDGQRILVPFQKNKGVSKERYGLKVVSKINVNMASKQELQQLPGIGPKMADAIIEYRSQYGQFLQLTDLLKIKGVGTKVYQKLLHYIEL